MCYPMCYNFPRSEYVDYLEFGVWYQHGEHSEKNFKVNSSSFFIFYFMNYKQKHNKIKSKILFHQYDIKLRPNIHEWMHTFIIL